jgi:hypothetical protein
VLRQAGSGVEAGIDHPNPVLRVEEHRRDVNAGKRVYNLALFVTIDGQKVVLMGDDTLDSHDRFLRFGE